MELPEYREGHPVIDIPQEPLRIGRDLETFDGSEEGWVVDIILLSNILLYVSEENIGKEAGYPGLFLFHSAMPRGM